MAGEGGAVGAVGEGGAAGAVGAGVEAGEGVVGAVGVAGVAAAYGAARTRLGCTHRTRGAVRSACRRREGTFGKRRSGPCSAAYVSKYGGDMICAWDARSNLKRSPQNPSPHRTHPLLLEIH